MGQVIHLHARKYVDLGLDKAHAALSISDEIIAKVLSLTEVSRMARIEVNLRQFIEAKWEKRLSAATTKATSLAKQLKSASTIASSIDKEMKLWAGDVTDHFLHEQARIYKLAREAGFKKATRQTDAPLGLDTPNATAVETGEPVAPNPQMVAEDQKPVGIVKAKTLVNLKPTFDLADQKSIEALNQQQTFWIGNHYENNVAQSIRETTRDAMAKAGKDRVAAGAIMSERVKDTLRHVRTPAGFVGSSKQYFEGLVANAATVARAHGQIRSFSAIGITRYTITNPGGRRICPVCSHVNGKTFTIQQGVSQMEADLSAKTPDDVRAGHPWKTPKQMREISSKPGRLTGPAGAKDSKALADAGMALPSYHFRCRCTVDIDTDIGSFDQLRPFSPIGPGTTATPISGPIPRGALSPADLIATRLTTGIVGKATKIGAGVNDAQKVNMITFEGGKQKTTKAVMKLAKDESKFLRPGIETGTFWQREQAMFELDRLMGSAGMVVPPTVARNLGGKLGNASIQSFVKGAVDTEHMTLKQMKTFKQLAKDGFFKSDKKARRMFLLDAISGNDDRHMGNVMFTFTKRGGKSVANMVAIDNGLTFPEGEVGRFLFGVPSRFDAGKTAEAFMKLDAHSKRILKKVKLKDLAEILNKAEGPNRQAIRSALIRTRALQKDPEILDKMPGFAPDSKTIRFIEASDASPTRSIAKGGLGISTTEVAKIDKILDEVLGK